MSDIPDWKLERLASGSLPAAEDSALRAQVAADPEARERLAALERDGADILAALPPARVAAEVERRARRLRRRQSARRVAAGGLVAAAAAVVFVALPERGGPAPERAEPAAEITRAKGEPRLLLHRKRGDSVVRLGREAAAARAGDQIQVAYQAAGARHGAVLSFDGAGVVTLHWPAAGAATALDDSGPVALPHAYELDDAPDFERFVFVTAAGPIDLEPLLAAARELAADPERAETAALALPPDHRQWSMVVAKEPVP